MQNQIPKKLYVLVPDKPSQIQAESAMAVHNLSEIIRTCLGPRAMQKMVLTRIGSIEITNDGNSILREIEVSHPAARYIMELARTQDDEVGDGTTSVVILAAKILRDMSELLSDGNHPIRTCNYLYKALDVITKVLDELAVNMDTDKENQLKIIKSSVSTKLCSILKVPVEEFALDAAKKVFDPAENTCDIKNSVRIEKIMGNVNQTCIIDGIILNKDIIHPQMRKHIENPRIILLDTPIEYRKGESKTNYEFSSKSDFTKALESEERQITNMCASILEFKPDIVVCEKGICDLALDIFQKNNVTALRRLKKMDNKRLAKATGAKIVTRVEDLEEKHIGTGCKLFEYTKISEDYYCSFTKCENPKACSILIRGPTRDIMNELERNFNDAVKVARNILISPKLVPGGGCSEMNISKTLLKHQSSNELEAKVFNKLSESFKVIPSILLSNSAAFNPLIKLTKYEEEIKENKYLGVDGISGEIVDIRNIVMEPYAVKRQCIVSAIQAVTQLMRIDGILESKQ